MCSDFLIICRVRIGTDKSSPIWNYLSLTEVKNRLYKSHLRLELRNGLKSHWPANTGSRVTRSMKILVIQHWMSLSENKCHQFQLSSVTQSWPTLCNPMKCSMPGFPILHYLLGLLKLMSIESVMPSNHLILCHPLLLLPSIFRSIRWPKHWSFNFSISPSNEYSGLIPFRMDWLDLLAVQWTLKSLLQHHSQKHQFFDTQFSL